MFPGWEAPVLRAPGRASRQRAGRAAGAQCWPRGRRLAKSKQGQRVGFVEARTSSPKPREATKGLQAGEQCEKLRFKSPFWRPCGEHGRETRAGAAVGSPGAAIVQAPSPGLGTGPPEAAPAELHSSPLRPEAEAGRSCFSVPVLPPTATLSSCGCVWDQAPSPMLPPPSQRWPGSGGPPVLFPPGWATSP